MSAEDKTTGNKNKITITNDKGRLRLVPVGITQEAGRQAPHSREAHHCSHFGISAFQLSSPSLLPTYPSHCRLSILCLQQGRD